MKIVGSRYFHPNIVFRKMSCPTLLCMVKHSASVGHQAQHATWPGPRPAHCCCQRGKWFVCGYNRLTTKQTHILDTCCYWMNRLFEEPLCCVCLKFLLLHHVTCWTRRPVVVSLSAIAPRTLLLQASSVPSTKWQPRLPSNIYSHNILIQVTFNVSRERNSISVFQYAAPLYCKSFVHRQGRC